MIGGIIERVVHVGPEVISKNEDGSTTFPNTIKLICRDGWDRCAVHVATGNYQIEPGDKCWWQSGTVYWTKPGSRLSDVKLQKVGFSYSGESLDLPMEGV